MPDTTGPTVDMSELRLGFFVHLDLGWMDHPFPLGSFKISSQQQIETIRSLGLKTVRYAADKSDAPVPVEEPVGKHATASAQPTQATLEAEQARQVRRAQLQAQKQSLQLC